MHKTLTSALLAAALLVLCRNCPAHNEKGRLSPHETIKATLEGDEISITYGRPYTKDPNSGQSRQIWGGLVPFGKVWRLGADEATLLTTRQSIQINGKTIPAGTYSLFLLPGSKTDAQLIVNKQTGQWGTKYDETQDLVRVPVKGEALSAPVEQLNITIEQNTGGSGALKIAWEKTAYSAEIRVQR
jgi:hypothetical protein